MATRSPQSADAPADDAPDLSTLSGVITPESVDKGRTITGGAPAIPSRHGCPWLCCGERARVHRRPEAVAGDTLDLRRPGPARRCAPQRGMAGGASARR